MFPYEFNYPNSFKRNIYGNIAIVLSMVGIIVFYIYKMSNTNSQSITIYVLVALSIITAALIGCLLFMPLQFLRTHIILSTLAMTSSFAMPALGALLGYESLKMVDLNYEKALSIIAIVTGAILAVTMVAFLFNPRATYKIYLDKSVDKDGNEVMARPKFIPIAFNEWCKKINATDFEKQSFQILFDVANAINVLNPIYEIATGNDSDKKKMHLNAGLFALTLFK